MNKLSQNITNLFGGKGEAWLNNLPTIIETLSTHWKLTAITPVDNMTFNYVAKAILKNKPVVLKISCDETSIVQEKNALNYFDGNASIKLIDYSEQHHALLLQQAVPGTTLKTFYPSHDEFVMNCYAETMQKLHDKSVQTTHHFPHINDWLKAIDKASPDKIPKDLLDRALYMKNELLSAPSKQIVLHGDLHHDNILKHDDIWLTIDPKGIIGEAEFEAAAFDFMTDAELTNSINIKKLFIDRAELLSKKANLNAERTKNWVFIRLILSAAWSMQDNSDPSWAIKIANAIA